MVDEKLSRQKKSAVKITYPPPADGLCVRFLCNFGCSANEPVAQAGRGALQAIDDFTKCKVLKGNAARLHKGAGCGHGRGSAGVPVSLGGNFQNVVLRVFSKTRTLFLRRVLALWRGRLNSL